MNGSWRLAGRAFVAAVLGAMGGAVGIWVLESPSEAASALVAMFAAVGLLSTLWKAAEAVAAVGRARDRRREARWGVTKIESGRISGSPFDLG